MKPRIGDRVIVPWRTHRNGTQVIGGWQSRTVIATRGRDYVIVADRWGWERVCPVYEVKPYPRRRSDWPKVAWNGW